MASGRQRTVLGQDGETKFGWPVDAGPTHSADRATSAHRMSGRAGSILTAYRPGKWPSKSSWASPLTLISTITGCTHDPQLGQILGQHSSNFLVFVTGQRPNQRTRMVYPICQTPQLVQCTCIRPTLQRRCVAMKQRNHQPPAATGPSPCRWVFQAADGKFKGVATLSV